MQSVKHQRFLFSRLILPISTQILPLYGFEMKELQQGMFLTALSGLVSYDLKGGIAPIGPPVSGCPRTLRPQRKDSMQMSGIIDHLNL
jgi:hypothetical protein